MLGTIYCSIATAALVKQRLKVNGKCIIPLELERSVSEHSFLILLLY